MKTNWILPASMGCGLVALLLLIACLVWPERQSDGPKVDLEASFQSAIARVKEGQSVITVTRPEHLVQLVEDPLARKNISYLAFSNVELKDERFRRVNELPELETLVFDNCRNMAGVLEAVRTVDHLRLLSFESSGPSGEDLRALVELTQLERIQFQDAMSFDEIESLRALMPSVEIEWIRK